MKNANANRAPIARRIPIAKPAFALLDIPLEDPESGAAVDFAAVDEELVDSMNEDVGEEAEAGEDVAAAACVFVGEVFVGEVFVFLRLLVAESLAAFVGVGVGVEVG